MAFSTPHTWLVGELVTAALMNVNVRDNLNYLKGNAGTVALGDDLTVAGSITATGALSGAGATLSGALTATAGGSNQSIILGLSGASGSFAGLAVGRTAAEAHFAIPGATNQFFTGSVAGDLALKLDDTAKKILIGMTTAPSMVIAPGGVGIGTTTINSKCEVAGDIAINGTSKLQFGTSGSEDVSVNRDSSGFMVLTATTTGNKGFKVGVSGNTIGFFGATPVGQRSSSGVMDGTNTLKAYMLDIYAALKALGLHDYSNIGDTMTTTIALAHIRSRRTELAAQLAETQQQYAQLEQTLRQLDRNACAMAGAIQEFDALLADDVQSATLDALLAEEPSE